MIETSPVAAAKKRVLVFGARGYVGTNFVARLMREEVEVRATARRTEMLAVRGWQGVEIMTSDVLVPATLPPALQGVDTAYYLRIMRSWFAGPMTVRRAVDLWPRSRRRNPGVCS